MDGDAGEKLPPLPGSDKLSLDRNRHDSFYDLKARDFWAHASITREELRPFEKCEHYFEQFKEQEVKCNKCHIGYMGTFEVRDGKLYVGGKPLPFN